MQGGSDLTLWPLQLVCAFSYPWNNHSFPDPGCSRGFGMFPGKECLCGAHTRDYGFGKGGNTGAWLQGTQ